MYIDGSSPFGGTDPWFQSGLAWLNGSDANPTPGVFTPRMRLWYWNGGNTGLYGLATGCGSPKVWGATETDARMNRWYADNQPGTYYVNFYRTVASHEIGHLLGLGHNNSVTSCSSIAIMYSDPNNPYSCGQYNPRPADVNPINTIY